MTHTSLAMAIHQHQDQDTTIHTSQKIHIMEVSNKKTNEAFVVFDGVLFCFVFRTTQTPLDGRLFYKQVILY